MKVPEFSSSEFSNLHSKKHFKLVDDDKTHRRKRLSELSFLVVGTSLTLEGSLRTPRSDNLSCLGIELRSPLLFRRWFRLLDLVSLLASRSTACGWRDTSSPLPLAHIVVLDALVFIIVGIAGFSSSNSLSHGVSMSSSEMVSKLLGPTDEEVLSDMAEISQVRGKERGTTDTYYRALRHFGFLVSWQHFTRIVISICKS